MPISSDHVSLGCNCSGIGAIVHPSNIYIHDIAWQLGSDENRPNDYNCDHVAGGIKYELNCYRPVLIAGAATSVTTFVIAILLSLILIGTLANMLVKSRKTIRKLHNKVNELQNIQLIPVNNQPV